MLRQDTLRLDAAANRLEPPALRRRRAAMKLDDVVRREARHFLPVVNRLPVALVEGRGSRVRDIEGREYVDLTGGWGVVSIGHCHPALVEAIAAQAGRLMQTTNAFYTLPQLDLVEKLAEICPPALTRSFIVNSGTEAMDGALKLVHRATGRTRFVSTRGSFHGRTLGALQVIGQPRHRDPYKALLREPTLVPFDDLEAAREAMDDEVAAFVVEPVQGEGGVNVPRPGYLAGIRDLCDRHGALLLLDEIQTGIGRTGRMLALEHEGVVPDVLALGKGLGGGFPVASFSCTEAVTRTVARGDHGGTYVGNPVACAAANTVLRVVIEERLVERAAEVGGRLGERLARFALEHPDRVLEARGRGLLQALALRDPELAAKTQLRAIEQGVLVNVTSGSVIRFFPALNIPEDDLWPAVDSVLQLVAA
jgi:acetylornithine/succinyldiaminopimelate/putrescine aminotransferase